MEAVNLRVGHLSDVLFSVHAPIWITGPDGKPCQVGHVRPATIIQDADMILVAPDSVVLGEFEDQRVKLDLDKMRLEARDVKGRPHTLAFGTCPPG